MLANTDLIVGFCDQETDRLLAFARAVTDTVYKAFIFDVIVSESNRGRGLGREIVETILAHPSIKDIPHIELYCPERFVTFYQQFGFEKRDSVLLRRK
jgi:predicted GNAT family N-acyltransferase